MDVGVHTLRYFLALTEELHFGRAAARLHLTTPSLSQQIARLEARMHAPLFERSSRGVQVTAVGDELVPLARAVVDASDALERWASSRRTELAGTVRVGIVAAVASRLRPRVHHEMARRHPEVGLVSRRLAFQEEVEALRGGRCDVAYAPEPLPHPAPGIRSLTVSREPRVLVVPSGHRLAGREAVSIEETNDEEFIVVATTDPRTVAHWLVDPRADGSSPRRGRTATDIEDVLDLCALGHGLNVAGQEVADHYARPGVAFVPLLDVEPARVALCWRADERDPAVLAVLAVASELAGAAEPTGA